MKFFSPTHIGLSVKLPNGQNKRISFSPLSAGGSIYYTTDPGEIYALQHHYRYGTLFRRDPVPSPDSMSPADSVPVNSPDPNLPDEENTIENSGQNPLQPTPTSSPSGKKEIPVTDLDDAKEYLSRYHGYSRTKLKFKSDVLRAAERQRIKFIGI